MKQALEIILISIACCLCGGLIIYAVHLLWKLAELIF